MAAAPKKTAADSTTTLTKSKTKDKTPVYDDNVYVTEFQYVGKNIPKEAFEKFATEQAKLSGARGYLENTQKGVFEGRLEGQKNVLNKFRELMMKAPEFKPFIKKLSGPKIPKELFEKFAKAQAAITGVKGYIENVREGVYKGRLEGEKEVIEKFQTLLTAAEQFKAVLEKVTFEKIKEVKSATAKSFEVK